MSNEKETKREQCTPEPDDRPRPSSPLRSTLTASPAASSPPALFDDDDASSSSTSPSSPPSSTPDEEPQPRGQKRPSESEEDHDSSASSTNEERPTKKQKLENDENLPPPRLKIKRHSPKARVPTRGSALAAGYDLYRLGATALNCSGKLGTGTHKCSAQKRRLSRLRGRASSIPRFRLQFLLEHMDASPRGVASVGTTQKENFLPLLTCDSPAAKFGIDTGAGVIDADYRGLLYILLFNLGENDFEGPFPAPRLRRLRLPVFFQSARVIALPSWSSNGSTPPKYPRSR